MDDRKEREVKRQQEIKLFMIYMAIMLALLFVLAEATAMISYADTVVLAEEPNNVGGNGSDSSSSFVIDISNDGGDESLQSHTPSVVYVIDPSDGADTLSADVSSSFNSNSSNETNESPNIIYKDSGSGDSETKSDAKTVTAENGDEIYVPDSDDDCPVSSAVPLSVEVQEYIWNHCKRVTGDYKNYYAFILGAIQLESEFKRTAIHHNGNGTTDRGLMQINSCNIKECKRAGLITCTDDLWDIYKNIDCGFHEMNEYIKKFGVCESAYYAYNTGRTRGGSNKNSRVVMNNMAHWNAVLFG